LHLVEGEQLEHAAFLAAGFVHATNQTGNSVALEPWQVINLVGSVVLAAMFLPLFIEDLQRWRKDTADRN